VGGRSRRFDERGHRLPTDGVPQSETVHHDDDGRDAGVQLYAARLRVPWSGTRGGGPQVTVRLGILRSPFYGRLIVAGVEVENDLPFYVFADANTVPPSDWLVIEARGARGARGGDGETGTRGAPGIAGCPGGAGGPGGNGGTADPAATVGAAARSRSSHRPTSRSSQGWSTPHPAARAGRAAREAGVAPGDREAPPERQRLELHRRAQRSGRAGGRQGSGWARWPVRWRPRSSRSQPATCGHADAAGAGRFTQLRARR